MNRRGFFGRMLGGIAALCGVKAAEPSVAKIVTDTAQSVNGGTATIWTVTFDPRSGVTGTMDQLANVQAFERVIGGKAGPCHEITIHRGKRAKLAVAEKQWFTLGQSCSE